MKTVTGIRPKPGNSAVIHLPILNSPYSHSSGYGDHNCGIKKINCLIISELTAESGGGLSFVKHLAESLSVAAANGLSVIHLKPT